MCLHMVEEKLRRGIHAAPQTKLAHKGRSGGGNLIQQECGVKLLCKKIKSQVFGVCALRTFSIVSPYLPIWLIAIGPTHKGM